MNILLSYSPILPSYKNDPHSNTKHRYTAKTMGSLGQRFPGTSVTADLFSWHISTGKPYNESYHIFLKQARRPVDVYFHSTEDIKGIKTDRFLTEKDFLNREYGDNIKTGTGVPFDGVECLTYACDVRALQSCRR